MLHSILRIWLPKILTEAMEQMPIKKEIPLNMTNHLFVRFSITSISFRVDFSSDTVQLCNF